MNEQDKEAFEKYWKDFTPTRDGIDNLLCAWDIEKTWQAALKYEREHGDNYYRAWWRDARLLDEERDKNKELEEKLAVAEFEVASRPLFCERRLEEKLNVAIEALEYYADVNSYTARECECTYVAEDALEKIKG